MQDLIKYYCNLRAETFLFINLRGLKMDNCRINYTASRSCRIQPRESSSCRCLGHSGNSDKIEDTSIYAHADQLPLTMAYVPCQKFSNTFELCRGFQMGTIFPELCKPFCGKRGGCR
ncbi:MAG TPA: spore coat associated protein CotJA [Candidatus Blautia merdigallinarum]|uniref:Spore coat associated protein CotJA n=1 Tax=Candidatus Blautia merdigallinarum TaxID=2838495 RepID=A0A9D2SK96_9FIRM|nr:spore coat associated protein CotJA [Candidatus Blautia merdigallinarum]